MTGLIPPAAIKAAKLIRSNNLGMTSTHLAPAARGRWVIVASMPARASSDGPARSFVGAISGDTLWALKHHRLVDFSDAAEHRVDLGDYRGRRHLDSKYGYPIKLTDAGRAL
jgi:hypothetical protein